MSDEDPLINGQPLSSLRVVDLKEELEKLGLSKSGNKKELADRLKAYFINGTREETSPVKSTPEAASPAKSPENSLVAAYKARQAAALNKATAEKERVRRQSEHESPEKETPPKESPKKTQNEEEHEPVKEEKTENEKEKPVEAPLEKLNEKSPVRSESPAKESTPQESSHEGEESNISSNKEESRSANPKMAVPVENENHEEHKDSNGETMRKQNEQDDHVELDYGDGDGDADDNEESKTNGEDESKSDVRKDESEPKSSPRKSAARSRIEAPKPSTKVTEVKEEVTTRQVSPSRFPPSDILHIRGLMRPFTIPLLKNEISREGGEIVDFWIDNIRSHCFVKLSSVENSTAARNALHGVHWPASNPKALLVQFDNQENMDRHKNGEAPAPVSASVSRTISNESHDKTDRSGRDRPTLAPLSGRNGLRVTLETMVRDNNKKEEEERERREKEGREKARELEKKIKDREAKEKEERENRKRQRSETPPHSRTVELKRDKKESPERRERRRNESETKKEEKEEMPVKTADEFFKKTVAQPCIYYLPLTDEQVAARAAATANKEREKR